MSSFSHSSLPSPFSTSNGTLFSHLASAADDESSPSPSSSSTPSPSSPPSLPMAPLSVPPPFPPPLDVAEESECPLCLEPFDETDRAFTPCKCSYKVCLWCFHSLNHLHDALSTSPSSSSSAAFDKGKKLSGKCPGCRRPFEHPGASSFALLSNGNSEVLQRAFEAKRERIRAKNLARKAREEKLELISGNNGGSGSKMRVDERVIQRSMLYVTGLQPSVAQEELLGSSKYFGKFGKILKIALNRRQPSSNSNPRSNISSSLAALNSTMTYSAHITFKRESDCTTAIECTNNTVLMGSVLKAMHGTSKYCPAYLRYQPCTLNKCGYLHEQARREDVITREQLQAMEKKLTQDRAGVFPLHLTAQEAIAAHRLHLAASKEEENKVAHHISAPATVQAWGSSARPAPGLKPYVSILAQSFQSNQVSSSSDTVDSALSPQQSPTATDVQWPPLSAVAHAPPLSLDIPLSLQPNEIIHIVPEALKHTLSLHNKIASSTRARNGSNESNASSVNSVSSIASTLSSGEPTSSSNGASVAAYLAALADDNVAAFPPLPSSSSSASSSSVAPPSTSAVAHTSLLASVPVTSSSLVLPPNASASPSVPLSSFVSSASLTTSLLPASSIPSTVAEASSPSSLISSSSSFATVLSSTSSSSSYSSNVKPSSSTNSSSSSLSFLARTHPSSLSNQSFDSLFTFISPPLVHPASTPESLPNLQSVISAPPGITKIISRPSTASTTQNPLLHQSQPNGLLSQVHGAESVVATPALSLPLNSSSVEKAPMEPTLSTAPSSDANHQVKIDEVLRRGYPPLHINTHLEGVPVGDLGYDWLFHSRQDFASIFREAVDGADPIWSWLLTHPYVAQHRPNLTRSLAPAVAVLPSPLLPQHVKNNQQSTAP